MEILIIPDVHLKPWMFKKAEKLLREKTAEQAVGLMDIADEWRQEFNLQLYADTYDAAICFARDFPQTLWCYGNHDISYVWNMSEPGYSQSVYVQRLVNKKLQELKASLPDKKQLGFLHRIDNVLFSHGGLTDWFASKYTSAEDYPDVDRVIETINNLGPAELWQPLSPMWCRSKYYKEQMYKSDDLLQVVGHTPVREIEKKRNLISCDVFSTDRNRRPIGTQEFLLLDTQTWSYTGIK